MYSRNRFIDLCPLIPAGIVGMCVVAGCAAGDRRPVVERTDSAGIALITAGAEDAPLEWSTQERFTVGGSDEGPESFYRLAEGNVASDDAGRVHVLHGGAHRVVVFERDGTVLRTLGRQGSGPGELNRPATIAVTNDGMVSVFDYDKVALVRWDSAGVPQEQIRFVHRPLLGGRHHKLLSDAFIVSTGGIDSEARRVNRLILVHDADTTVLASVHQPNREKPAMFPSCGGGINFPPLFTPHVVWDHRDGITAVAPGDAYRIDLYRGDTLFRSIRRDVPVTAATRELAIAEAGDGFRINFGAGPCVVPPDEYVEARGWAATVPAIATLAIAPDGGLWVQRRVPGDDRPPIDVFDASGAYVGTLPTGTPFPVLLLRDGAVAFITTDEDEVQRLTVADVVVAPRN